MTGPVARRDNNAKASSSSRELLPNLPAMWVLSSEQLWAAWCEVPWMGCKLQTVKPVTSPAILKLIDEARMKWRISYFAWPQPLGAFHQEYLESSSEPSLNQPEMDWTRIKDLTRLREPPLHRRQFCKTNPCWSRIMQYHTTDSRKLKVSEALLSRVTCSWQQNSAPGASNKLTDKVMEEEHRKTQLFLEETPKAPTPGKPRLVWIGTRLTKGSYEQVGACGNNSLTGRTSCGPVLPSHRPSLWSCRAFEATDCSQDSVVPTPEKHHPGL